MFSEAVIYDTETTDADPTHGQVLEFGAVHADPRSLAETSTTEIDIRLLPYIVPAPAAMDVCGFAPGSLTDDARIDETEAARRIAKILKPGYQPKLQATWNGLKFDSPILRTMMWRNLLDPYVTSGRNVRQLDVLNLARLAHFIDAAIVACGQNADGKPSWRLQDVAPANGIELKAHRAVNDARGTLAVMRQVFERARPLFNMAVQRGDGQYVSGIASPAEGQVLYLFTNFGEPKFEPVMPISFVKGQTIAARLDDDLEALMDGDVEAVASTIFSAGGPCCAFKPNGSPMLFTAAEAASVGLDVGDAEGLSEIARTLRGSRAAETARQAQERSSFPSPANTPEARIYEKFPSSVDKERAEAFHAAKTAPDRIRIAQNISDIRMREMAARMIVVHSGADVAQFVEAIGSERGRALEALGRRAFARPHADAAATWMTIAKARAEGSPDFTAWMDGHFGGSTAHVGSTIDDSTPELPAAGRPGQMSFGF